MRVVLLAMLAGCGFQVSGGGSAVDAVEEPRDGSGGSDSDAPGSDGTVPADATSATIRFVQGTMGVAGGTSKPVFALSLPVVAGDLCVLGIGVQSSNVVDVTDSGNNTWTSATNVGGLHTYVAANMAASANDFITVNFAQSSGYTGAVACYRGLATASPVDAVAASSGNGNAMDSGGTAPTQHAHDLIVGIAASNGAMTASAGFTTRTTIATSMIADRDVSSTASYHATATSGGNITWAMAVLALKAND